MKVGRHDTPPRSLDSIAVLHLLRVKGLASTAVVATIVGVSESGVQAILDELEAQQLVSLRDGRVSGWRLTATGAAAHTSGLAQYTGDAGREAAERLHDSFVLLNPRVKQLCTDWQLRDGSLNDHSDAGYDQRIVTEASALHREVDAVLAPAAKTLWRISWYRPRLQSASDRFACGDPDALVRPLSDSYHDVWMELHQDLILTLGLTRTDADT